MQGFSYVLTQAPKKFWKTDRKFSKPLSLFYLSKIGKYPSAMVAYSEVSKATVCQVKVKWVRIRFSVTVVHGTLLKSVAISRIPLLAVYTYPASPVYPFALSDCHNGSSYCLSHPYGYSVPY